MYASLLVISGALHLGIFEQPAKKGFFSNLLEKRVRDTLFSRAATKANNFIECPR